MRQIHVDFMQMNWSQEGVGGGGGGGGVQIWVIVTWGSGVAHAIFTITLEGLSIFLCVYWPCFDFCFVKKLILTARYRYVNQYEWLRQSFWIYSKSTGCSDSQQHVINACRNSPLMHISWPFFWEIESEVEGGIVLTTFFPEVIHRNIGISYISGKKVLGGGWLDFF